LHCGGTGIELMNSKLGFGKEVIVLVRRHGVAAEKRTAAFLKEKPFNSP
jgi:hypothetical protein